MLFIDLAANPTPHPIYGYSTYMYAFYILSGIPNDKCFSFDPLYFWTNQK